MAIPLEDNFADIIGKAQRGLGISDIQLAEKYGASVDAVGTVRDGKFDRAVARANCASTATRLEMRWPSSRRRNGGLTKSALTAWPNSTPAYHDMMVNAYLVWDPASKEAVAFDSGADCSAMLKHQPG